MDKIKKFFRVLGLFVFCIDSIYHGHPIRGEKYRLDNFIEIWKYCEAWERGEL